jgi:hypothetical protein
MKINELNKLDQLEEGPVWDKVKQLGAGTKGFFQGGATGARAGYNAQGTANQMTGKIKDISMLVLQKWQEFNQAYKMANGGQDAGAEQAVQWFIKFTGGQKPKNPNPPSGNSPAQIQKWLQQEIANTMAQRAMAKVQGDLPDISGLNREELLQLKQQLTATGLNEDILNEVDWSKVKNAVAGGAISLAALGLPGLANADAQKMTPEQIRAWVQQSVKNKTPLQAQQIVNKLNVAPTADTPAVATPAPTATPAPVKAEPAPPTADPSVARKAVSTLPPGGASKPDLVAKPTPAPVVKAEPTLVPKAEPAPVAKAEPKADPTEEPTINAKDTANRSDGLSNFSIKNLRFGMDLQQVLSITNPMVNDYSQRMDQTTYQYPKKSATTTWESLAGYSIAGRDSWTPNFDKDGKLQYIMSSIRPDAWEDEVDKFTRVYGKPKSVISQEIGNRMGWKGTNRIATWTVKDAEISIARYGSKIDSGYIFVSSKKWADSESQQRQTDKEKATKDFE